MQPNTAEAVDLNIQFTPSLITNHAAHPLSPQLTAVRPLPSPISFAVANMAFKKDRVKPTAYPFLPFHALRSAQLVSSLIVASIMSYFLRELSANNYSLPWTFILVRHMKVPHLIVSLTHPAPRRLAPHHPRARGNNHPTHPPWPKPHAQPHSQRQSGNTMGALLQPARVVELSDPCVRMRSRELGV